MSKITLGIAMVFLLSAMVIFGFSIYRSLHGHPSQGPSGLGFGLFLVGVVIGHSARKAAK